MSMVTVIQNDRNPDLYLQLFDKADESAIDLSASALTIQAKFRLKGDDTILFTATCSKVLGGANGLCKLEWPVDALDVDVGRYEIEISVTDAASQVQTAIDKIPVKVKAEF